MLPKAPVWARTTRLLAGLCCVALAHVPAASSAQSPRELARTHDAPLSVEARLAQLEAALEDIERPTRAYWGAWVGAMAALGGAQLALALLEDGESHASRGARGAYLAGSGLSALGLGLMLALPHPGRHARRTLATMPTRAAADRQAKLTRAEALLEGASRSARRARGWLPHTLAAALSLGLGLGLGLGYRDWSLGLRSGAGALFVIELRAWTRPTGAVSHWRRYAQLRRRRFEERDAER